MTASPHFSPVFVARVPMQKTGEKYGLGLPRSSSRPEPVLSEPEPVDVTVIGPPILVNRERPHVLRIVAMQSSMVRSISAKTLETRQR